MLRANRASRRPILDALVERYLGQAPAARRCRPAPRADGPSRRAGNGSAWCGPATRSTLQNAGRGRRQRRPAAQRLLEPPPPRSTVRPHAASPAARAAAGAPWSPAAATTREAAAARRQRPAAARHRWRHQAGLRQGRTTSARSVVRGPRRSPVLRPRWLRLRRRRRSRQRP